MMRGFMTLQSGLSLASTVLAILLVPLSATAQCLQDGHPVFGSPAQRPDIEQVESETIAARVTGVAFGDLDGDGDVDAVCTQAGQGSEFILELTYLTVLMNRGDGVFDPPTMYKAGREVVMPALGDVDLDGDLDVAVTNARDDTISLFLNDGWGALGPEAVHATGAMPRSLLFTRIDADEAPDLVVFNIDSDDVSILLSDGRGGLAPEIRWTRCTSPSAATRT